MGKFHGKKKTSIVTYNLLEDKGMKCFHFLIYRFIKISYDCVQILNMWVMISKLQGTGVGYF